MAAAKKKGPDPLPIYDWDELEAALTTGRYAKTKRLNVAISNLRLHQILLAQNDRFHTLYSYNIRLRLDDATVDKELMQRVTMRWQQHALHPMVTGLKSTGVAANSTAVAAAATHPLVAPPLGPDPALLFVLHVKIK